jgi:hypothetical protein
MGTARPSQETRRSNFATAATAITLLRALYSMQEVQLTIPCVDVEINADAPFQNGARHREFLPVGVLAMIRILTGRTNGDTRPITFRASCVTATPRSSITRNSTKEAIMKPQESTTCIVCGTEPGESGGCPWQMCLLMFEATVAEEHRADLEQRPPRSSNVIELFQQCNKGGKLSEEEVAGLFDAVSWAYRRIIDAGTDGLTEV